MSKATVEVKGTWPILKYTIRTEGGGYAVVMIDDQYGDVLINPGNQIAFQHWWGENGRGEKKLRSFLVRSDVGYFADKFSYGLSRWTHEQAIKDLYRLCEEHFGHPDSWSADVKSYVESLEGLGEVSSDLFYDVMNECDEISDAFGHESIGGVAAHPEVSHFLDTKWPALVEHWKMELANEQA